ncbi:20252_t:CDS:2 [Funneliformis geosporum]|uniref:9800_t:CDS:1 n=1 Tax=Funneliformis geosporum TaxID=1117311 RepID=A0A9W4SRF9_9GLOM|nr:20252_t:CDS:2 [Funneliformis geosporum]CAI2178713.1 9800_t:CDS:2 [Funneliformis geosporum]
MAEILLQSSMVIGPVLGYFDQIAKFRKTKSSAGFSLDTSGILLVSSIIRVFFWFGKRFDDVLLYQSIIMIITQLIVLYESVKYRLPYSSLYNPKQRQFWNWSHLSPYLTFLGSLVGVLSISYLALGDQYWFIELLGFAALGIESTVPMPQTLQNFQKKSVAGFSPVILLTWFFGDAFKAFYYTHTGAPLQFILCGVVQLMVDSQPSEPLCVGHRGYPDKFPENTLKSLQKALIYGANALESDVRYTKDGQVIMMHDNTLDTTTNGTGLIDDKNWVGYIEYLNSENESIPRFQDVLDLLKQDENVDVFLIVDIKEDNRIEILDAIADIIQSNTPYNFSSQLYLGIWTPDFLVKARKVLPEIPIAHIGSDISEARKTFFEVESYNIEYPHILSDDTGFAKQIKIWGKKLFVWTLEDPKDIKKCFEIGNIDAILVNDPMKCINAKRDFARRKKFWKSPF